MPKAAWDPTTAAAEPGDESFLAVTVELTERLLRLTLEMDSMQRVLPPGPERERLARTAAELARATVLARTLLSPWLASTDNARSEEAG